MQNGNPNEKGMSQRARKLQRGSGITMQNAYYKSMLTKKENNESVEFALETEKYELNYKIQRRGETHNENETVKKKWSDNKWKR